MNWRTDKPTEKVIVAKLTEDFCHQKDSYAILRLANEPYQHYSEDGEEIPYAAIEKWASPEEGYEQAEYAKELAREDALTWEDIQSIDNVIVDLAQNTDWPLRGQEVFYEYVLRRFREMKDK